MGLVGYSQVKSVKATKRVGRGIGSGLGKTSGRGQKGQKARSGGGLPYAGFEGGQMPLFRRLARRGFTSPNLKKYTVVLPLDFFVSKFDGEVTLELLKAKGVAPQYAKRVKILLPGQTEKLEGLKSTTITAKGLLFSKGALKAFNERGGKVVEQN